MSWADWDLFATKIPGFIKWAEPPPADPTEERYAVARNDNHIRWVRISPKLEVPRLECQGAFYGDTLEEAVADAVASAVKHKAKINDLIQK